MGASKRDKSASAVCRPLKHNRSLCATGFASAFGFLDVPFFPGEMNMAIAIQRVAFTCAILLSAALGHAQSGPTAPNKPPTDGPAADGFQKLLNGRDLTGWQIESGQIGTWQVDGPTLVSSGSPRGWLFTDKEYSDFELRLEYKLSENANSGISIRSPWCTGATAATDPSVQGMEIQIVDDEHAEPAMARGWLTGSIWGVAAPSKRATRPVGQWNAMTVVARGRQVTVSINNTQVLDVNLDNHADEFGRFPGLKRNSGFVGLQSWAGRVEFRNLAIKSLAPSAPAAAAATPHIDRIEVFKKGIYEAPTGEWIADPTAASGKRRIGGQVTKFLKATDTIPAEKGVVFGFGYKIIGEPKNSPVTIKRVFIFPPGGLYNPKTGKTTFKESADVQKKMGESGGTNYVFGDWGAVLGTWTFQLWHGDRLLVEETFNVVNP
jgi:hypothetical protein